MMQKQQSQTLQRSQLVSQRSQQQQQSQQHSRELRQAIRFDRDAVQGKNVISFVL